MLWPTTLILATQEAEIRKNTIIDQSSQKVQEIPSQTMVEYSGTYLSSQLWWEA
jgi:hypothetical protein